MRSRGWRTGGGWFSRGERRLADLLLCFRGPQVAFGLVAGGRDGGVGEEPQHVGFAVLEAFQQVQGGGLLDVLAAGSDLGQALVLAPLQEQLEVLCGQFVRDGGQALVAGHVGGVDEGAHGGDLAGQIVSG